jgi:SAM-dependent methyltransferase
MALSSVTATLAADYSPIAWFYDRHWSGHYHPWALEMLQRALLVHVPEGAPLLDVCCGNGVLARELGKQGYQITGLDTSTEMLSFARLNAPFARFLCADAREFHLESQFCGALSTFDSLNHILTADELSKVFANVYQSLLPGGRFVFDLNLEEGYLKNWGSSCCTIDDEHACFIRGQYDESTRLARTEVSLFRNQKTWERKDIVFLQRFHPEQEVLTLLREAGFDEARCLNAITDLEVEGYFGVGRGIFVAIKAPSVADFLEG